MIPIIDGHNDCLLHLYLQERGQGRSFFEDSGIGHIDLPRARSGGLAGGFFAMFVPNPPTSAHSRHMQGRSIPDARFSGPARPIDPAYAQRCTQGMMALFFEVERQSKGQIKHVLTAADMRACLDSDRLGVILHCEGADCIDADLDALEVYWAAGLRSLGIVWSRANLFGTGVPFANPATPDFGPGLTDAGKALVQHCNELGILIDLSHLNEKGFFDVAELSDAPLVATHSAVHALCPSARNLTDAQIDAIGRSGGVIGVNCYVGDLRSDGGTDTDMPLKEWVAHVRYIADRIGVAHIAIGSDLDGASMPDDLKDITGLPKLLEALRDGGFGEQDILQIAYENWLGVLEKTWKN